MTESFARGIERDRVCGWTGFLTHDVGRGRQVSGPTLRPTAETSGGHSGGGCFQHVRSGRVGSGHEQVPWVSTVSDILEPHRDDTGLGPACRVSSHVLQAPARTRTTSPRGDAALLRGVPRVSDYGPVRSGITLSRSQFETKLQGL